MTLLIQKVQNKPDGARKTLHHQRDGRQNVLKSLPFLAAADRRSYGARAGLSQGARTQGIGVPKGTLLSCGQARRRTTGPAQVLLVMVDKRLGLVAELLG